MVKKIYVGNLSFQTPENEVRRVFEQFGSVRSVSVITDRETGRSKGFGFVEMEEDDAVKAIASLSGSELNGRPLTVNEAKPLVRRASASGDYRGGANRRMRY
jgi:RNA recognition motif-containing protein